MSRAYMKERSLKRGINLLLCLKYVICMAEVALNQIKCDLH